MVKDIQLARRIRGDRDRDFIDRMEKTGDEKFYSLPYSGVNKGELDELSFSQTSLKDSYYSSN